MAAQCHDPLMLHLHSDTHAKLEPLCDTAMFCQFIVVKMRNKLFCVWHLPTLWQTPVATINPAGLHLMLQRCCWHCG
jgi:hypothetical protein